MTLMRYRAVTAVRFGNSQYFLFFFRLMVRPERFELPALWFEARCSIQLSYGRSYWQETGLTWRRGLVTKWDLYQKFVIERTNYATYKRTL